MQKFIEVGMKEMSLDRLRRSILSRDFMADTFRGKKNYRKKIQKKFCRIKAEGHTECWAATERETLYRLSKKSPIKNYSKLLLCPLRCDVNC